MDQSDNSIPNQPSEQNDLAKQYQDILDRYSEELAKLPPPDISEPIANIDQNTNSEISTELTPETNQETISPEPVDQTTPDTPISPDVTLTEIPPPETVPSPTPIVDAPPYQPNIIENLPPPVIPTVDLPSTNVNSEINLPVKKSGGFFKFLFYLSLIIFLGVCGAIAYSLFFAGSFTLTPPSKNTEISVTPSPAVGNVCELNEKKYGIGESFEAADGCNTCTCTADLLFVCTENVCDITPTTPPATSSAKPTVSDIKKIIYKLPDTFQTVNDSSNTFQLGFNPDLYTSKTESGLLSIIAKNLNSDPKYFYSEFNHTTNFKILPYDNGSRHTFIEKQLGEPLSSTDQPEKIVESDYLVTGKKCLIISGIYISQSPTVVGMCPISTTKAILFTSFDLAAVLQHLSTLKFL